MSPNVAIMVVAKKVNPGLIIIPNYIDPEIWRLLFGTWCIICQLFYGILHKRLSSVDLTLYILKYPHHSFSETPTPQLKLLMGFSFVALIFLAVVAVNFVTVVWFKQSSSLHFLIKVYGHIPFFGYLLILIFCFVQ